MRIKQLVSSAQQHTLSVVRGQKVPCQAQCDDCGASIISPGLPPPDFFLFPCLKDILKGQFSSAKEVIAKAMIALPWV
jgi:hypothetical protein